MAVIAVYKLVVSALCMVHGVVWIKITWPLLAIHGGLGPYC